MMTVKEVSRISGVSVRTLHHYDAIGLLSPAQVTPAGYRLYDEGSMARLKTILLLRELQFPLKKIGQILDSPGFDPISALEDQILLLELQRQHLDELIAHARSIQQKGVIDMDFTPFDRSELDRYADEAAARWGKTDAYQEYSRKTAGKSKQAQAAANDGLMDLFRKFGQIRDTDPTGAQAQAMVKELQDYITTNYYTCTPEILKGLGQMYVCDERMQKNIDKAGGEGTAAFASQAIAHSCK